MPAIKPVLYDPETLSSLLWRNHQMETFSTLLTTCARNSPVTSEFPAQRPVTRSFDVSLISAQINGQVNNGEAGDLRRHRAHYDVTVMFAVDTLTSCSNREVLLHVKRERVRVTSDSGAQIATRHVRVH